MRWSGGRFASSKASRFNSPDIASVSSLALLVARQPRKLATSLMPKLEEEAPGRLSFVSRKTSLEGKPGRC